MKRLFIKILNWFLVKYYQIKGFFRSKKLKKNYTYFGGVNKAYAIYMGDNTFYEQKTYNCGAGVLYTDASPRKYNYLQLGLFEWTLCSEIKTKIF